LAVINSIQEGMAAELNFQAIIDLVGDKLRKVLKSEDIGIRWHDPNTNLIHYLYEIEHGKRFRLDPIPLAQEGPFERMLQTRRAVVYNTREENQSGVIPGPIRPYRRSQSRSSAATACWGRSISKTVCANTPTASRRSGCSAP
jgi:hypothetical protein